MWWAFFAGALSAIAPATWFGIRIGMERNKQ